MCRLVRLRLAVMEAGGAVSPRVERHMAACLRCQAERARARRVGRELLALSSRVAPAPRGFDSSVAVALTGERSDPFVARSSRRPRAVLAGAAALAAGGAALAAWRLVRRPA